jgi:hypothetical protein
VDKEAKKREDIWHFGPVKEKKSVGSAVGIDGQRKHLVPQTKLFMGYNLILPHYLLLRYAYDKLY